MDDKSGPLLETVTALANTELANELLSQKSSFESGGKRIGVVVFKPKSAGKLPAIVVLHGARGVDATNAYVRELAQAVAANGYATFLIEYFDRTGTVYADEPTMRANGNKWLAALNDGVSFISKLPDIDANRIGIFGYSLGGYLAVAQSSRDPRIKAVVELAGGIQPELARTVTRLPPTLIIHGKEDGRVPFSRATELEALARRVHAHVETEFFPSERHILSPVAALRAIARALQFFRVHLAKA